MKKSKKLLSLSTLILLSAGMFFFKTHPVLANDNQAIKIISVNKTETFNNIDDTPIILTGENFEENISVFLVTGNTTIPVIDLEIIDSTLISFKIDNSNTPAGSYEIIVRQNSNDIIIPDKIQVSATPGPIISKISPKYIFQNITNPVITISGKNFEPESEITLKNSSAEIKLNSKTTNSELMIINDYFDYLDPGYYNIRITNPDGSFGELRKAIKLNNPDKGLLQLDNLYIGLGHQFTFLLPQWQGILEHSPIGFNLNISYPLRSFRFLKNYKYLENTFIECELNNVYFFGKNSFKRVEGDMNLTGLSAGAGYKIKFNTPFELIGRLGISGKETILNKENSEISSSTDFGFYTGISTRYTYEYFYFLECGVNLESTFTSDHIMMEIPVFARAGIKL